MNPAELIDNAWKKDALLHRAVLAATVDYLRVLSEDETEQPAKCLREKILLCLACIICALDQKAPRPPLGIDGQKIISAFVESVKRRVE